MTCSAARTLLPERSLGTLTGRNATELERHLAWCAACRKEARELGAAAASLVFALAPREPAPELEDRVVAAVQHAASGRTPAHRRGRMVVAATVAAMLAVAGLGFGAVMAGRAARFRDIAITTSVRNRDAVATFRQILQSIEFTDPGNSVEMGQLTQVHGGPASGTALTLLAPSGQDMAVVTVAALRVDPARFPLVVTLVGPKAKVRVGAIAKVDSGGAATIAAQLDQDLAGLDQVVIRDVGGDVVLRGELTSRQLQSPSPRP
ncbi:MAG: zf-HC2 domain-containing protein [Actinomycetota bacterium]